MINDQAILHLLGRLEHENVTLRAQLAEAQEQLRIGAARIVELEAERVGAEGPEAPAE